VITGLEDELGEELIKTTGDNAVLHIENLTVDGAAQRLVNLAISSFGKLDAIVNNAAWVTSSNLQSTHVEYFRKVLEINTIAPFVLIQAAVPQLSANNGCVVNIGSVNAYSGEPNLLAYSVSKGALMTMTRNLGDTLFRENGIRVNQVNPGWVLTETETIRKQEQGLPIDWYRSLPGVYAPSGRILTPAEIAAAVVYLLSDECGPVSGQVMDLEQYPFIGRNPPKDHTTLR
jgi:NAD(P)-dependent dehydrogenase (short-subunit alcohol dehydrogenase family)